MSFDGAVAVDFRILARSREWNKHFSKSSEHNSNSYLHLQALAQSSMAQTPTTSSSFASLPIMTTVGRFKMSQQMKRTRAWGH
eukprot:1366205-Amorphochlora_amoeboformis.AAC.2